MSNRANHRFELWNRLTPIVCYANVFISYMPLIILPIFTFNLTNSFFIASLSVSFWRLITYFKFYLFRRFLCIKPVRLVLFILLLAYTITNWNIELKLIIFLYFHSLIYSNSENEKIKKKRNWVFILIIVGMLFSGIVIENICFIYILIGLILVCYVFLDFSPGKPQIVIKRQLPDIVITDYILAAFHNFQYYFYAFLVPILYVNFHYLAGLGVALSWILFLPQKKILNVFFSKWSFRIIIVIGFIITGLLLVIIGCTNNILLISICLFFQGITGGLSESYWDFASIKSNPRPYWNIWKIMGIAGSLIGGFFMSFFSTELIIIIAGAFAIIFGFVYLILGRGKTHYDSIKGSNQNL